MHRVLFTGPVRMDLHGTTDLQLIERSDSAVTYQLTGFEQPTAVVQDKRRAAVWSADHLLNGQLGEFQRAWAAPALLTVVQTSKRRLLLTLEDTPVAHPHHTLWLAYDIQPWIPAYDYLLDSMVPYGESSYALLALYRQPMEQIQVAPAPEMRAVSRPTAASA